MIDLQNLFSLKCEIDREAIILLPQSVQALSKQLF
jgi:hypothetical protein